MKVKFHLGTVKLFLIIFLSFHLIPVWNFACISQKGFICLFSSSATWQHILFRFIFNWFLGKWFVPRTVPLKTRKKEKLLCQRNPTFYVFEQIAVTYKDCTQKKNIPGFMNRGLPKCCYVLFNREFFYTCHNNVLKLSWISTTNCRNIWCTACRDT